MMAQTREAMWGPKVLPQRLEAYFTPRLAEDVIKFYGSKTNEQQPFQSKYYYGLTGTGKTVKAAADLLHQMFADYMERRASTYRFITLLDLLLEFRALYSQGATVTEKQLVEQFVHYDYLVIDELGKNKVTDWNYQLLYQIINGRVEYKKPTIYTGEHDIPSLAQIIDESIIGRILQQGKVIKFNGRNYRLDQRG